uniref:TPRA_2 n=1 Tax=Philodina roseola TaxID=96448 RepID=B2L3L6_PHIRO|nr:TPRA_2 [Philodina roseola]
MSDLGDEVLICLNTDAEQSLHQTIDDLRQIIHRVHLFFSADACVDFMTDIDQQHVFLIISQAIAQQIIPHIHSIPCLCHIYIIKEEVHHHLPTWIDKWQKIRGLYPNIQSIQQELFAALKQNDQDMTPLSIVCPVQEINNTNLGRLEPSFMYTQLFKEVLLSIQHDEQSQQDFITFCRERSSLTDSERKMIDEFERDYSPDRAIRWYTRESFIYQMLNQSLRLLQADVIVLMGFFIADLHRQIEKLHKAQCQSRHGRSFTVYRGQRLSSIDFAKLVRAENGLISFNSFLSTSRNQHVPMVYAQSAADTSDMYGILFHITVDPVQDSASYADIDDLSYFHGENEVLFTMHSVFRISQISELEKQHRLVNVYLKLATEDDEQLKVLSNHIRQEIGERNFRRKIADLLIQIYQPNLVEKLYQCPPQPFSDYKEIFDFHHYNGIMKLTQGKLIEASVHLEKALFVIANHTSGDDSRLSTSSAMLGSVYEQMGEYSKALSSHQQAFDIIRRNLPTNHASLAACYCNIASMYFHMDEYSKALSHYQQALYMMKKSLPPNHSSLAISYGNIAAVYDKMGEYSKALSFNQQALSIRKKSLPSNHPSMAISYSNIAAVYFHMGEYSKALSINQHAVHILKKSLPSNHPSFATSLPPNHPSLATSYAKVALVYDQMGEYSKALSSHQQALDIMKKILPPVHSSLAISYGNIAVVYFHMGEYSKALYFNQRALEMMQKTLPPNHPSFATIYDNIALLYCDMGEYPKAYSFHQEENAISKAC